MEKALLRCVCVGGGRLFANCNVRDFNLVKGKLNQTDYHSLYCSITQRQFGCQRFVLMQNNNEHTSKLCLGYINNKEEQHVLQLIWPVQSADLNPIELVWDELNRKVRLTFGNSCGEAGKNYLQSISSHRCKEC